MSTSPNEPSHPDDAPASTRATDTDMTPAQIAESKRYGRRELACTIADMGIDCTYLAIMAFWGAARIDRWLDLFPIMANNWLRLVAIYAIVMAFHYVVSLPLSIYSGYFLEKQFGLTKQTLTHWFRRYVGKNLLAVTFGGAMAVGLFAIIWWTGRWWWLVAAASMFLVSIVLGQLVPVVVMPLFYKIEPLEDDDLASRFQRLTSGTSLRVRGVYRLQLSVETTKANAMLAGLGRTRRVLLGDTLLQEFSPAEIEVVLAHEIGHHVHHHIAKLIGFGLVVSAASFWVCDRILAAWGAAHLEPFTYASLPPYALPLVLLLLTVISLTLSPLQNGLSRWFEVQADQYALDATNAPATFRTAFTKLAQQNKADPNPPRLEVWLLHDHPPIGARLALADAAAAKSPTR